MLLVKARHTASLDLEGREGNATAWWEEWQSITVKGYVNRLWGTLAPSLKTTYHMLDWSSVCFILFFGFSGLEISLIKSYPVHLIHLLYPHLLFTLSHWTLPWEADLAGPHQWASCLGLARRKDSEVGHWLSPLPPFVTDHSRSPVDAYRSLRLVMVEKDSRMICEVCQQPACHMAVAFRFLLSITIYFPVLLFTQAQHTFSALT